MKSADVITSSSHAVKTVVLIIIMILDIYCTFHMIFVDFNDSMIANYPGKTSSSIIAKGDYVTSLFIHDGHIILQMVILFWIFFLVWKTFPFRFSSLIGKLIWEFKLLLLSYVLDLAFFIVEKAFRVNRTMDFLGSKATMDPYSMWDVAYFIIFFLRCNSMIFFYGSALKACHDMASPEYYRPEKWHLH